MIEFFISLIGDLFGIASFQLSSKQAKSDAISKLRHAIRLTTKHIQDNRSNEFGEIDFSDVESTELSGAWSQAATAIRPFDERIAEIFENKSDYWLNPEGFRRDIQNGQKRFDYRFRLSEVEKELKALERRY